MSAQGVSIIKIRQPKRVLHFSDGILEIFDDDEETKPGTKEEIIEVDEARKFDRTFPLNNFHCVSFAEKAKLGTLVCLQGPTFWSKCHKRNRLHRGKTSRFSQYHQSQICIRNKAISKRTSKKSKRRRNIKRKHLENSTSLIGN